MSTAVKRASKVGSIACRELPARMKVLYIASRQRTGGWLAEAFAHDSASEILLEEVVGSASGLARLRDEVYDALLVSHVPEELDALDLIEGYRAGGAEEPIVVLGLQSEQEMAALCYEVGADAYVCVTTTTTRNLIWTVARAVQQQQLASENRRLNQAERQRLQREHDEAQRLLLQQRALIQDLEAIGQKDRTASPVLDESESCRRPSAGLAIGPQSLPSDLPSELVEHYRELLRTYVIMGSGNLGGELGQLSELLAAAGVTARDAMQLHLHVLEDLVRGLGTRSTRHVMNRADLLVMEIMIHLAESYRLRYRRSMQPAVQLSLPGFGEPAPRAFD